MTEPCPCNLREVNCTSHPGALRAVLLLRPDAHPCWHTYLVSLLHLRAIMNWQPAHLAFADASHEIGVVALDPASEPDPEVPSTLRALMPPNLVHQLRGRSDAMALSMFGAFVQALSSGELNPDTDHRHCSIAWLQRWGQAS